MLLVDTLSGGLCRYSQHASCPPLRFPVQSDEAGEQKPQTLWNGAQSHLMRTQTYGRADKRRNRVIMLLQMTCWLVNDVSVSRWFANVLAWWGQITPCGTSPSLHASHDSRVSVTPFNPITPTWSDTNSITALFLLLSTRLVSLPLICWYSFCHQRSVFFSILMSWKAVAGSFFPPFFLFCLPLKNHPCLSSFISLASVFSAQRGKIKKPW